MTDQQPAAAFREVQKFRQPWVIILLVLWSVVMLGALGYALCRQYREHADFQAVLSNWRLVGFTVVIVLAVVLTNWLLLRAKLVTEVADDGLRLTLFLSFARRTIRYADIADCQARTYRPLLEYGGWGVRYSWRHGRAYNVSGNRGVQLVLKDGQRLLIGSQQADELAAAIRQRLGN